MPITPKREIEIEEELAKIEAEIDREIERDRKRPHKLMLKSKPTLDLAAGVKAG